MKRIITLGIVVFLVIAFWSGAWLFASNEIRKAVVSLADADGHAASVGRRRRKFVLAERRSGKIGRSAAADPIAFRNALLFIDPR